jgi:hypothetical protein
MWDGGSSCGWSCGSEGRLAPARALTGVLPAGFISTAESGVLMGVAVETIAGALLTAWWPDPGEPVGAVFDPCEMPIYQVGERALRSPKALTRTTFPQWHSFFAVFLLQPCAEEAISFSIRHDAAPARPLISIGGA